MVGVAAPEDAEDERPQRSRCSDSVRNLFEYVDEDGEKKDRLTTSLLILSVVIIDTSFDAASGIPDGAVALVNNLCLSFYTLEMLLKFLAYGILRRPDGYLRTYWGLLDLVVLLSAYLTIIISAAAGSGYSGGDVRILRIFRTFRLLRTARGLGSLKILIQSFAVSAIRLLGILLVSVFFVFISANVGHNFFGLRSKLRYYCTVSIADGESTEVVLPVRHCRGGSRFNFDLFAGGRSCYADEICERSYSLPSINPLLSFDDIGSSIMTVATFLSHYFEGEILNPTIDAAGQSAMIYFLALTVLGSILLANYFPAIYVLCYLECKGRFNQTGGVLLTSPGQENMSAKRISTRSEGEKDALVLHVEEEQRKTLVGRIKLMWQRMDARLRSHRQVNIEVRERRSFSLLDLVLLSRTLCGKLIVFPNSFHPDKNVDDFAEIFAWHSRISAFSKTPLFSYLLSGLAGLQALMICIVNKDMSASERSIVRVVEDVTVILFALSLLSQLFVFNFNPRYFCYPLNLFDSLVTILSLIGVISGIDGLRTIRLLRFLRLFSHLHLLPDLNSLLHLGLRRGTGSATIAIAFAWIVYSLVGQQLFPVTPLPRFSSLGGVEEYFSSFGGSFLIVQLLMTGNSIFSLLVEGSSVTVGIVPYLMIGSFVFKLIIMKTFLAVLIDNLETDDREKVSRQIYLRDKNKRELQEESRRQIMLKKITSTAHFHFKSYSWAKFQMQAGSRGINDSSPVLHSCLVYFGWHLSDAVGQKGWMEMREDGSIGIYALVGGTMTRPYGRSVYEINTNHATVIAQSSARRLVISQPSQFSLVLQPDSSLLSKMYNNNLHREVLVFLPSQDALVLWLQRLEGGGARMSEKQQVLLEMCCYDHGQSTQMGFSPEEVKSDGRIESDVLDSLRTGGSLMARALTDLALSLQTDLLTEEHHEDEVRWQQKPLRRLFKSEVYETVISICFLLWVLITIFDTETSEALLLLTPAETILVDCLFTSLLLLETCAKAVTFGVVSGSKEAILRSMWGIIELLSLLAILVDLIIRFASSKESARSPDLTFLRSIPILRVIRPIAGLKRFHAIRVFLDSLWRAKSIMLQTFFAAILLSFTCCAICSDLYCGKLVLCNDQGRPEDACLGTFQGEAINYRSGPLRWSKMQAFVEEEGRSLILKPRMFYSADMNFDDFVNLARTIGVISCPFGEGWLQLVEDLMLVKGDFIQDGPKNVSAGLPVIVVVLFMHILVYNLLIAILIRTLRQIDGLAFLTSDQRSWRTTIRLVRRSARIFISQSKRKSKRGSRMLQSLASSREFRAAVDLLLLLNVVLLALNSWDGRGLATACNVFVILLAMEQLIQLGASSLDLFNRATTSFDFVVTIISCVECAMNGRGSVILVLRSHSLILAVVRLRSFIPSLSELHDVLASFKHCLQVSFGCLVFLLVFIAVFSIIGMQIFSDVKANLSGITPSSNYIDFPSSFRTNFQLALGAPYLPVLFALTVIPPSCTPDPSVQGTLLLNAGVHGNKLEIATTGQLVSSKGDCGTLQAWIYLLLLIGVCRVCIMPLFVASVISALMERMDDQRCLVDGKQMSMFEEEWLVLDPHRKVSLRYRGSVLSRSFKSDWSTFDDFWSNMVEGSQMREEETKAKATRRDEGGQEEDSKTSLQDEQSSKMSVEEDEKYQRAGRRRRMELTYEEVLMTLIALEKFPSVLPIDLELKAKEVQEKMNLVLSEMTANHERRMIGAMERIKSSLLLAAEESTMALMVERDLSSLDAAMAAKLAKIESKMRSVKNLKDKVHSWEDIHNILKRRIFVHNGSDPKLDPAWVLLCKGSCSSGKTGLLHGADADYWRKHLLEGRRWRLTEQDEIAIAIPKKKERLMSLVTVLEDASLLPEEEEEEEGAAKQLPGQHVDAELEERWEGAGRETEEDSSSVVSVRFLRSSQGGPFFLPFHKEWLESVKSREGEEGREGEDGTEVLPSEPVFPPAESIRAALDRFTNLNLREQKPSLLLSRRHPDDQEGNGREEEGGGISV
ncbi:hypothetical protein GUITHDRAFT_137240 [Guillardia theta CCMP2712]|uniref:Ion transport domain-containing protein n=1 Tax=Guillardia theta (strain CCMP2712) TaxID=905079 RepID=L1JH79_GUITC|nr:hypothetical protein GUITHDRAFT_137240 [Guillardia theta CCMP2712]EKX47868.1 hypothetical protein GUITHDRAFT_137240 [Guillardia theta CCMP2712]|eukprot:XP_005834848.1 hypothetical protein GUITHDRAFT_137240 [Guillardia theta CCMP2712]